MCAMRTDDDNDQRFQNAKYVPSDVIYLANAWLLRADSWHTAARRRGFAACIRHAADAPKPPI
jgi:hypothetical protein